MIYKDTQNKNKNKSDFTNTINSEDNEYKEFSIINYPKNGIIKNVLENINLNIDINKKKANENKASLKKKLDIKDFRRGLLIKEPIQNIISANKIKNKKDLFILSDKQNEILSKTIKYNNEGFYFNLKTSSQKRVKFIISTNEIKKNTLLTKIGGTISFYKDIRSDKS